MMQRKKAQKDIYAARNRKKRRRVFQQGMLFLILAAVVLVLYRQRDSWLPGLQTIGKRHQTRQYNLHTGQEGNFPLYVGSGTDCQIGALGDRLLVLSDSYLQMYSTDGDLLAARQHTYGSAMLSVCGNYALLYESGGTGLRVETESKIVMEKTLSDPIIFARISENGLVAAVTSSSTSVCSIVIFNLKGQELYKRSCLEQVTDLAFREGGEEFVIAANRAENGVLQTVVRCLSCREKEALWESKPLDTMAISVYNTKEGGVCILGNTHCCFLTSAGALRSSYLYPDSLVSAGFANDTAVLLFSNSEKRTKSVAVLEHNANQPIVCTYDRDIKNIAPVPERNAVLIQFRTEFQIVSYAGKVLEQIPAADSCESFLRIGSRLFLRGYDSIDTTECASLTEKAR